MSEYSVAEAKTHLSRLIDRALAGESVTITRRGKPAVTLSAATAAPGETFDGEWFKSRRVKPLKPFSAAALIREMRDEGP